MKYDSFLVFFVTLNYNWSDVMDSSISCYGPIIIIIIIIIIINIIIIIFLELICGLSWLSV